MRNWKRLFLISLLGGIALIAGLFIFSNQFRVSNEGFRIYLLDNELVISDSDIISYNKTSHQIKLNEEGISRIKKLDLYHKYFVLKLNGKELYNGSFWSDIDSMPYTGVAIIDILAIQHGLTNIVRIEPCYPLSFCKGVNPRDNPEIVEYFQRVGKLIQ